MIVSLSICAFKKQLNDNGNQAEEDSQAAAGIPEEDTAEDNQAAGGIHDYESIRAAEAAEDIQAAGAEEAL